MKKNAEKTIRKITAWLLSGILLSGSVSAYASSEGNSARFGITRKQKSEVEFSEQTEGAYAELNVYGTVPAKNPPSIQEITAEDGDGIRVMDAWEAENLEDATNLTTEITITSLPEEAAPERAEFGLYSVTDGSLDTLIQGGLSAEDVVTVSLAEYSAFALAVDSGLRETVQETGDVVVSGMLPIDAEAAVADVSSDYDASVLADAAQTPEEKAGLEAAQVLAVYEISVQTKEEEAYQPADEPVHIEISHPDIAADKEISLWDVTSGDTPEQVTDVTVEDGKVGFEASAFSVYMVVETKLTETIVASDRNTYEINLTYKNTSGLPMAGTELLVSEIMEDDPAYESYFAASADKIGAKAENIEFARAFDIKIVDVNDHETVYEPTGDVEVSIRLVGEALDDYANVNVLHFVEDETEEGFTVYDVDSTVDGESVQFTTDSFSVYVVAGYVLETTIDIEGQTYKVTATYDDRAGIPGDAKLNVSEMDLQDEGYLAYLNETAEALGVSAGELGYLRMLDISIEGKDGTKYKPNNFVKISVELMDSDKTGDKTGDLRVVHFGAETEELDATTEGDTVSFATDSFSLFSFVDLTLVQNIVDAVFGSTYKDKIYENDDIIFSGRMPRTAVVEVNPAAVEIEGEDVLVAYDIKIYAGLITRALGITWQPSEGALTVRMKSDALDGREDVSVYHYADGSAVPEKVAEAAVSENTVEFKADSFSVYALGGQHLRTYRFFTYDNAEDLNYIEYTLQTDEDTTTFTQILKDGESLVVPQLPAVTGGDLSYTFSGWYAGTGVEEADGVYTYTSLAGEPYDFENLPAVTETETVYLFARFASYSYVVFHDQWNGSANNGQGSFPVAMTRRGELTGSPARTDVRISDVTVQYDDSADENTATEMAFYGWSYTPIRTPGADTDENGDPVHRIEEDSIEFPNPYMNPLTKAVDLYPIFIPIHWLNYYSGPTGSGATYIPSHYYYLDEGAASMSVPVRSGYTFQGWYTGELEIVRDEEGNITEENVTYGTKISNADGSLVAGASDDAYGAEVKGGVLLLSQDVTLYARWEEAPVNYTVVVWRQKVTDAAGLANSAKTYDYGESFVLTATTGTAVSTAAGYTQLTSRATYNSYHPGAAVSNDAQNPYYGFNYNRTNSDTGSKIVSGDGSTVLNVYYDRNQWTITFRANNKTTSSSNSSSPVIHTVDALYGANISGVWTFTGSNDIHYPVTGGYNTSWYPISGPFSGRLTQVSIMPNQNISFYHYVTKNTTRYFHYYVEALPEAAETRRFEGNAYSHYQDLTHDFNFIIYDTDFWELEGFTRYKIAAENGSDVTDTIQRGGSNGVSWNTGWNNTLYFYYSRNEYPITFVDSGTLQNIYVNGSQIGNVLAKYEQKISHYLPDEPDPKQLITDANGNITVQDRPGCYFDGWYTDESCSTRIFFQTPSQAEIDALMGKNYVIWDTMPAHPLRVYAGWSQLDYLIQIDPNGGEMKDNGATWYWEPYNGDPIEEYTWVTRNYIEAADGTWYYATYDRDYYGYDYWEWRPSEAGERHVYYTEDPSDPAADLTRTYKQAPNAYRYAGWYEVMFDENGNEIGETLYNFGDPVTHHTYLRLHWKKIGTYYLSYLTAAEVDGVTVTGTIDTGDANQTLFVELDSDDYADNADVVVSRTMTAPEGYNFIGWKVRNDASETVLRPGESFTLLSRYTVTVDGREVIYLEPVFTRVSTARIIYDANLGTISENELDYGAPTDAFAPVPITLCDAEAGTATIRNLVNNTEIRLSSGAGFSLKGEGWSAELTGWNTKPDASGEHFDLDTAYYVDTEDPITLYAEWQVKVYFHRNKTESAWGNPALWAGYTAYSEDVNYTTIYVNQNISMPEDIPVSTANPADNLYFRYWGTQRYGDASLIDPYDFGTPVAGELHLYAFWAGPIELPVHVLDASYETIEQVDSWRKAEKIDVYAGDAFTFSESDIAAGYVNVPGGYTYAFTAIHSRTDSVQNVGEDEEITQVYYNAAERKLYVTYADSSRPDAPLADTDEVYFVYYEQKTLPVGYELINPDGSFTQKHADTSTASLGSWSMQDGITGPLRLAGYGDGGTTYFAYALGSSTADSTGGLQIITSASNSDRSRPDFEIRNTWRGFEYSADGTDWIRCGYDDLKLYVVYFESRPFIVTLTEQTIGTAADMEETFEYTVTIETTTTTTETRQQRTRSWSSWNSRWGGWSTWKSSSGYPTSSTQSSSVTETFRLSDGQQKSETLFHSRNQTTTTTPEDNSHTYGVNTQTQYETTITTEVTQTITIVQASKDGFRTEITEASDGRAVQNTRSWTYTTSGASDDQAVTYTNTHTPLTVEVHLGIVGDDGAILLSDDSRLADTAPYTIALELDGAARTFLTEIPAESFYAADGYGFAGVYSGTDDGTEVTVAGPVKTVTYGRIHPQGGNICEPYFDGDPALLKGSSHIYYLYYPLPKVVYVKETAGGTLTRIQGSTDGTSLTDAVTYNGSIMTLNGAAVEQEQRLDVLADTFTISQEGSGFRMLPLLDDGTEKRFLRYTRLGAAGTDSVTNTNDLIAGSVTEDRVMYLKVDGSQVKWSLDGSAWNQFTGGNEPTVYAIYKEIGYTLRITKTVAGNFADPTRPFTLTISSDAITERSYAATGTGYNTVSATPATASAPGTIVLTIRDGSNITISGLGRGDYTAAETGNSDYALSALWEDAEKEVTDNQYITGLTLDDNKTLALTNTRKAAALTVTKTVTGDMGDRTGENSFRFTLHVDGMAPGSEIACTGTAGGTLTLNADGRAEFRLAHGETITFEALPLDRRITVTEEHGNYTLRAPETAPENMNSYQAGEDGVSFVLEGNASLALENNLQAVSPTGIHFHILPYLLMMAAGLILLVIAFCRRRSALSKRGNTL